MSVLIVNQDQIGRLLPMAECIEIMERALRTLARDDAVQPLRSLMWLPGKTELLGMMPGYLGDPKACGIKIVSIFPSNLGSDLDSHQGIVLLFDTDRGNVIAVMDATEITAIRTAAVSAVATRHLARDDACVLAVLGSGTQAAIHIEAMRHVRPLRHVRIWSRNSDNARTLADRAASGHGVEAIACASAREAVHGADIVCTTTGSREPVLEGAWLAPGTHINAVGACIAKTRELDTDAVAGARLFVDRRESALNEAGDVLIPIGEGRFGADHILGELGDVLDGTVPGRTSRDDRTLFKSLGLAVEDLAAAHHIYAKALHDDTIPRVEIGGRRR